MAQKLFPYFERNLSQLCKCILAYQFALFLFLSANIRTTLLAFTRAPVSLTSGQVTKKTMNNYTALTPPSPTCSSMVSLMFTLALSVISVAAFIGNVLVVLTFIKTRSLRTSTNCYIVNMAVSDLLGPFFFWPLYVSEGMLNPNIVFDESWASSVCKPGQYFRAVSQAVSILSLVLIAVDRFVAIVYPFKVILLNMKLRVILLALSWLIPILFGLPYALFSRVIKVEDQLFCRVMMSDEDTTVFHATGICLFYFLPLITIIILYSVIIRVLKKKPSPGESQSSHENAKRRQQNQKVLKILISIVIAFFICWTPLGIYLFLRKFYPGLFPQDKCLLIPAFTFYLFPSLSTAINPVILFVFSTNYKEALKSLSSQVFSRCKCSVFQPSQTKQLGILATQEEQNLEMKGNKI